MANTIFIMVEIAVLVFSAIVHEVSHGLAANSLGDPTAKYQGRLTLNPMPHIDPLGSIILPLALIIIRSPFLIAWAKPVPFNPYNLKYQKWGPAIVAAAGPISNISIAVIFGILVRLINAGIIPMLSDPFIAFVYVIIYINILLAVFNLVPIPPLDGSKVLFALLPYNYYSVQVFLERWGIALVFLFILLSRGILSYAINSLFILIAGTMPFTV